MSLTNNNNLNINSNLFNVQSTLNTNSVPLQAQNYQNSQFGIQTNSPQLYQQLPSQQSQQYQQIPQYSNIMPQFQQIPQQFNQAPIQISQAPQQFHQFPLNLNQAPIQISPMQQLSYSNNIPLFQNTLHESHAQNNSLRLINNREQDKNKQVVAIIVTINSQESYDHLFFMVQQKSQQGTRVLVYEASSDYIGNLIKAYEGDPQDQVAKQMMVHIGKVHPDCVVFNWQCCGFYASENFPQGRDQLFKFLKMIIDKGHMAMFSDFSLKALIKQWKQDLLGPNPFVKTGETSTPITMKFNAGNLKQCPSAQLQIVGEMAEGGSCTIQVLGGTIVYTVDKNKLNHNQYKLRVLSISTTNVPKQEHYQCTIGQLKGSACHVLLTYPSGGMILTSMGHWIELMKIDTSQKKLFQVAERNFGKEYAAQMQNQYASLNINQQQAWVSQNAVKFVQNQAPCSNMSKKAKFPY